MKRLSFWVKLAIAVVVLFALFLTFSGGGEAKAATAELAPSTYSFAGDVSSNRSCYAWSFGPWTNTDGFGNLRFGYGEDLTACTNPRGTRWVDVPTFQPYHWLGYYKHDRTDKQRSALGYWHLNVQTIWEFSWDPGFGVPTIHKGRTLRCDLTASNHTASCTLYYN